MKQKMSDKAKFIIITASNSTEMSNNQEYNSRGVCGIQYILFKIWISDWAFI